MTLRLSIVVALLTAAVPAQSAPSPAAAGPAAPPPPGAAGRRIDAAEALSWLPEDAIIIGAWRPTAGRLVGGSQEAAGDPQTAGPYTSSGLMEPLPEPLARLIDRLLDGATPEWGVGGIVDFDPPPGSLVGIPAVRGCRIVSVKGDLSRAVEAFDAIAGHPDVRLSTVEGFPVLALGRDPKRGRSRAQIVRPADGILITASNEAWLRRVLEARNSSAKRTDWARVMVHWDHVDREAPAWVVNRGMPAMDDRWKRPDGWKSSISCSFGRSEARMAFRLRFLGEDSEHARELLDDHFGASFREAGITATKLWPGVLEAVVSREAFGPTSDESPETSTGMGLLLTLSSVLGRPVWF